MNSVLTLAVLSRTVFASVDSARGNRDDEQVIPESIPRRDRIRAATVEEIKTTARRQLTEVGAAALSLRAIAREMGTTASALYRYFASRDDLVTELVADGFSSLADTLEAAYDASAEDTAGARWVFLAQAHRRWALAHPTEYALIYGTPVPGFQSPGGRAKEQLMRAVGVLFRCMIEGLASAEFEASALAQDLTPSLRRRLVAWQREMGVDLPPEALAACLLAWTQLHGILGLELFGHLPPALEPADALFDQQMCDVVRRLGGTPPPAGRRSARRTRPTPA